jgi:wyosine [tRNA(Phe)-imidazoG37] synthetase (radical SAM superfamily)
MNPTYKYLFGPVPSRRLGRSLGIDVTPFKTCSFDCVFCQCGCTTAHTAERSEFVPLAEVCVELAKWMEEDGQADVITFAGSGEPTLYSRLGELVSFIKATSDIPVMLLTNGTTLHDPQVRKEAALADRVKVSLSAWDDDSFQLINRPSPGVKFNDVLQGARKFRAEFHGELWLEVFFIQGVNDSPEQVQQIADFAKTIGPNKIHLNTAVRPPAEATVQPVDEETLHSFCDLFTPRAEVIASFKAASSSTRTELNEENLIGLIHRHPSTAEQLAAIVGADKAMIEAALKPLVQDDRLQTEERNGAVYYK